MKISQEEIIAANGEFARCNGGRGNILAMCHALTAAYTIRKARKQAKRERQRKEKDKQVQESANRASLTIMPIEPDETFTGAAG